MRKVWIESLQGLDSETLHAALLRAFFVMSQSISEWIFRPIAKNFYLDLHQ
jgi:hypothetical protein